MLLNELQKNNMSFFLKAILSKRKPDSKSYMQFFLGNAISQILPALLTNLIGKKNVVDHVFQDV